MSSLRSAALRFSFSLYFSSDSNAISSSLNSIGYPSLELKDSSAAKNVNKKKRRIYQLGFSMPCSENDENCVDDFSKSR